MSDGSCAQAPLPFTIVARNIDGLCMSVFPSAYGIRTAGASRLADAVSRPHFGGRKQINGRRAEFCTEGPIMTEFKTLPLPPDPVATAPDGTDVRPLLTLSGGSFAHFELTAGATSTAVRHRTVEEIWYFLGGRGEVWRRQDGREEVTSIAAGVSITIPLGTAFQFRALGAAPLVFVAVTMPPWPGAQEAYVVKGKWPPTVAPSEAER